MCADGHLNSTRAAEQGRGRPCYSAIEIRLDMDMQGHIEHSIITANREENADLFLSYRKKNEFPPWSLTNLYQVDLATLTLTRKQKRLFVDLSFVYLHIWTDNVL